MKKDSNNKLGIIIFGVSSLIIFLMIALHAATIASMSLEPSILSSFASGFSEIFSDPFAITFNSYTLPYCGATILVLAIIVFSFYNEEIKNKHYKTGEENGTADWTKDLNEYNSKFTEPIGKSTNTGENNMILTKNISLSMDSRTTRRNNNVLVVGGSGSGKSRFMVKPNILQANCNYIVTDPAGELLNTTGKFLENQGYEVKVFNLVEMAKSDQYNPFNYIRDELGVLMMINCLIKNTNPDGKGGGDPFWEKSETALLQALCFYLIKYCPKHQQNFTSVMKLLRAAEVDENDSTKKSKLDRIFDEVAIRDQNSIALKQYLTFKMGAGKTLKSILISCSVRLTVFNMKQIENLTRVDTLDLGSMGTGKKALFVIIPAADSTFNFLVSMMYSQLFETLYFVAETQCERQRLERPVRFLLDEFANIGTIPEFTKKLATMRKYEISCTVILQNLAQIKTMYKDDWESIVGNCDSFLFLGGQEYSTLEYISKELGKTTITVRNRSMNKGKSKGASNSFNQSARDLMSPDEIMRMPKDECILIINGLKPFYDKKFDYIAHKNYKLTGDADDSLLYINIKNNCEQPSLTAAETEYEKRKVIENTKNDLVGKTSKGLSEPPIPLNKSYANVSMHNEPERPGRPKPDFDVSKKPTATDIHKPNGFSQHNPTYKQPGASGYPNPAKPKPAVTEREKDVVKENPVVSSDKKLSSNNNATAVNTGPKPIPNTATDGENEIWDFTSE